VQYCLSLDGQPRSVARTWRPLPLAGGLTGCFAFYLLSVRAATRPWCGANARMISPVQMLLPAGFFTRHVAERARFSVPQRFRRCVGGLSFSLLAPGLSCTQPTEHPPASAFVAVALDLRSSLEVGRTTKVNRLRMPEHDSVPLPASVLATLNEVGFPQWSFSPEAARDTSLALITFGQVERLGAQRWRIQADRMVFSAASAFSDLFSYDVRCEGERCSVVYRSLGVHADYGRS
jgi:hypothetical protein